MFLKKLNNAIRCAFALLKFTTGPQTKKLSERGQDSFFYKFLSCLSYWCKHPVVVKFRTAVHTGYYVPFSANSERHSTFTVRALEKLVFIRPAIRSRIIFPNIT